MGNNVGGIGSKLSMAGVDLCSKSMTNIMQSKEGWAQGILKADRAEVSNARVLNYTNQANARRNGYSVSQGNGNVYGALQLGLSLNAPSWGSRDGTVTKAMDTWIKNLNGHACFRGRGSYTPDQLLQIASDANTAACTLRDNMKELCAEAEVSGGDINYWNSVADGLTDYAKKLGDLHAAVCVKQDPPIKEVTLDIRASKH